MPFVRSDLPNLRGKASTDVVPFLGGDDAHALTFGDPAGCGIGYGFGHAEDRKAEHVEPIVVDGRGGFGHQTLTLPRQAEPESAIVLSAHDTYAADEVLRRGFQTKGPMPLIATLHGR